MKGLRRPKSPRFHATQLSHRLLQSLGGAPISRFIDSIAYLDGSQLGEIWHYRGEPHSVNPATVVRDNLAPSGIGGIKQTNICKDKAANANLRNKEELGQWQP